ncbi:MAG: 5-formyltetrahydrofolate cyclo-ligase [Polyangiaceae bacterium]
MVRNPFEQPPVERELPPEEFIRRKVKAELRKRMRGLRNTTPMSACLDRSALIVAKLEAHPHFATARNVALFWPIEARHEVDLRALDASLRARGASVFYPAIDPETSVMTFKKVTDSATLEEAGYGFSEPASDAPAALPGELDTIVVPALAVAADGHRIGYGAGYYDRALPPFVPPAVTFVVAYDYQLISEVPVTEGDLAIAWVVTDRRIFPAGAPTSASDA